MQSYNVADAKAHLSEILERVSEGEEILLTRRGRPVARVIPVPSARASSILGAGKQDPNINLEVIARDNCWKPTPGDDANSWYE
jgi:prevent-host-death family protein